MAEAAFANNNEATRQLFWALEQPRKAGDVEALLRAGADVNARAPVSGHTPLMHALCYSQMAIAPLLAHGARFASDENENRLVSMLMYGVGTHFLTELGTAGALLPVGARGARPELQGGGSLLHYFVTPHEGVNMPVVVRALLGMGVDPDARDVHGRTALDVIRYQRHALVSGLYDWYAHERAAIMGPYEATEQLLWDAVRADAAFADLERLRCCD